MNKIRFFLVFSLAFCFTPFGIGHSFGSPKVELKSGSKIEKPKGSFTLSWGYNRDFFSKSNIHFSGPDYDFILYGVSAADRPSPFAFNDYFNPQRMWVPQYNYRIGYFLSDNLSLSLGMDHMKYVMNSYQDVRISGEISSKASEFFQGTYQNEIISISPDFLTFEHTNGFNLLSFDADYFHSIFVFPKKKASLTMNTGLGFGGLFPKTDVRVFGDGSDNKFHLAGYSATIKLGPRIRFLKHFFITGEMRSGFAALPSVLIKNNSPQRASHSLWYMEYYLAGGLSFRIGKS